MAPAHQTIVKKKIIIEIKKEILVLDCHGGTPRSSFQSLGRSLIVSLPGPTIRVARTNHESTRPLDMKYCKMQIQRSHVSDVRAVLHSQATIRVLPKIRTRVQGRSPQTCSLLRHPTHAVSILLTAFFYLFPILDASSHLIGPKPPFSFPIMNPSHPSSYHRSHGAVS